MKKLCLLPFALSTLLSGVAFADDVTEVESELDSILDGRDLEDISLEELLNISIVGASKYEQQSSEAPASVSTISREDIARYGYQTLGQALSSFGGISVSDDRNYGYIGVRGFGIPGDYNSRVLLLLNGHRMNDSLYSSAFIGHDFPLDIDTIERIELIRGANSSLYGSNAFFAVVNIVTIKGEDQGGVRVSLLGGAHAPTLGTPSNDREFLPNAGQVGVSYGNSFEGGLDVLVSTKFGLKGGQPETYFAELDGSDELTCVDEGINEIDCDGIYRGNDGESSQTIYARAVYKENLRLSAGFGRRRKEIPTAAYGTIFGDPDTNTVDSSGHADLNYQHEFGGELTGIARVFYDRVIYGGDFAYDYREADGDSLEDFRVINRDEAFANAFGTELRLNKHFDWKRSLFGTAVFATGMEVNNERFHQDNFDVYEDGNDVYLNSDETQNRAAVFAQADIGILKNLHLNGIARFDHYFGSFGTNVSPRIAAVYAPTSKTNIKLMYGRAFRAPNAYERYYAFGEPGGGEAQVTNADLDLETIDSAELGIQQYVGEAIRLQLLAYRYQINDLIILNSLANDDLIYQNLEGVVAMGAEFEVEARWRKIRARLSYALQRAEDEETEVRLVNSARHLARALVAVPLLDEKLYVATELRYASARRTPLGNEVERRLLANLTVSSTKLVDNMELSLSIKNLLDTDYDDPGSEEHTQSSIPRDGRTVWLKAAYLLK